MEIVTREVSKSKEEGVDAVRWLELDELDIDDFLLVSLDFPSKFHVKYFPSRFDHARHAERHPIPPALLRGILHRIVIEKENNFKQPGERYRSWDPDRQERFICRWIDALSDPRVTQEIHSIWVSYWSQLKNHSVRTWHLFLMSSHLCEDDQVENNNSGSFFTPEIASYYEEYYQSKGVKIIKGTRLTSFDFNSEGKVIGVNLRNGNVLLVDIVVVGIGSSQNTSLFEGQLTIENGGIKVNG